jgi:hypothetical protein
MNSLEQPVLTSEPTGVRVLWRYVRDVFVTEFWTSLRLLAAPVRALRAGSLEPIKSAMRRAEEDSDRVLNRYLH